MSRMQAQIVQQPPTAFAGIDVGKSQLDIFIHPARKRLRISNDKAAIQNAIRELRSHKVEPVALEATGTYHRLAHIMLHEAGFAVSVVNPFRSRQFAASLGRLAKTDMLDAESLALFAERMQPESTPPPDEQLKQLRSLQTARRQIVSETSDLKRRLQAADHPLVMRQIRARISMNERHQGIVEQEMNQILANSAEMKKRSDILISIPGIGRMTAMLLIAELPELGQLNAKQISALAGVAPMSRDSGTKQGVRMIRGGRQHIRNALYMCAVSCIGRKNFLGQTYGNLVHRGKNGKVAVTAIMRKIIILANTLIAENRTYEPSCPAERRRPGLA